ncbi:MAG: beta strand repeat-containing protein, partial [Candidatus Limnocylindrus sp.]
MSHVGRRGLITTRRLLTILVTAALMFVGIPGTISIVRGTPLASCSGVGALANGSFESISGTPTWNEYASDQSNDNLFGSEPLQVSFVGENLSSPGMNSWLTTASDNQIEVHRVREAGSYAGTVTASTATSATIEVANSDNAPFTGQDVRISGTRYNVATGRTTLAALADPYTFTIDTTSNAFTVGQSITYGVVYSVSSAIDSLFTSAYFDYSTVEPAEGSLLAELNANSVSTLYQDVDTIPGTTLYWSIQHQGRSRSGNDVMKVNIGSTSSQTEQTTLTKVANGSTSSVATISDGRGATGADWATYRGSYVVPAGQTITRFAFESVSSAISTTAGNFLDDISFAPLAACPLTRTAVAGTTVTINPFDTGAATFAYAPTGSTITSASITSGSGSVSITNSNTRLSFTPPSSAGSTVINYVLSYSQDGVASTSEGEITVTTSIQRPTIAWSSPTYGNDILDASCTTGAATQTTDGATRRIVFTAPSQTTGSTGCTFTPPVGVTSIEVLVVGGGGGGGGRFVGGGGGAGGLRTNSNFAVSPGTSYAITVGAGGAGGANSTTAANAMGTSGSSSVFSSITAAGGGGGGGYVTNPGQAGRTGGSGGGGSGSANSTNAGGAATPSGQGNNGGSGTAASGQNPGGGGGGAGGVGGNGGSSGGGAGGAGTSNNITGSFVTYAAGGGGGADSAAGGGAGGSSNVGGKGGNVNVAGANATSDTGSGGGGAGGGSGQTGGRGAAGIVIIKYDLGTSTTVPAPGTATGTWSVSSSGGGVQSTGTVILQSAPYENTSCGIWSDVGIATSGAAQSTAVNTCYRWTFDTALSSAAVPPTELAGNSSTENLTSIIVVALSPTVTGPADQTATNNVSAQVVGAYTANGFSGSSSISTSISISGVTGVTFSLPTTTGLTRTAGSSWTGISSVTFTSTRANAVAALSAMTIATNANNGTAEISVTMTEGSASASDSVLVNIGWVGRWPGTLYVDPQQASVLITPPFTSFPSVTNLA